MSRSSRWAILFLGLALTSCAPRESEARTVVLCVWEGVDAQALELEESATPALAELAVGGELLRDFMPPTRSATAAFGSWLTGLPPEEHGLRSIHELGANQLRGDVPTLAESLREQGWKTLASVSQAHFSLGGLERGFDVWHEPERSEPRRSREASEVADAVARDLEEALDSDQDVLLVLHLSDLRGRDWQSLDPSEELLERHLAKWRGQGGVIDEAFAAVDAEKSLGRRLADTLLRRAEDPRRLAMLRALYAEGLVRLDAELRAIIRSVADSGRLSKATFVVAGGAAGDHEGEEPGTRARAPLLRHGAGVEWSKWIDTRRVSLGAEGEAPERSRSVRVTLPTKGYGGMRVTATSPSARLVPAGELELAYPDDSAQRVEFVLAGEDSGGFDVRGASGAFFLRLHHPKIFTMRAISLGLGRTVLDKCSVPVMLAPTSMEWPEDAMQDPNLDLQPAGGRRLAGTIRAGMRDRVQILVEYFPADPHLADGIEVESGGVERHAQRPGAAWIRGNGFMSFVLPPQPPSSRLGLALWVAGERVGGSRIRYIDRTFTAPDVLELGFSDGAWLDLDFVGEGEPMFRPRVALSLVDTDPPPAGVRVPSPEALEYLSRLGEFE